MPFCADDFFHFPAMSKLFRPFSLRRAFHFLSNLAVMSNIYMIRAQQTRISNDTDEQTILGNPSALCSLLQIRPDACPLQPLLEEQVCGNELFE